MLAIPETRAPDRQGRRRPFTTWVKKLANFKNTSSGEGSSRDGNTKRSKKRVPVLNNPYPQSGRVGSGIPQHLHSRQSFSTAQTGMTSSATSLGPSGSVRSSDGGMPPPTAGARSAAPTVSTDHEGARSIATRSHGASSVTGTSRTVNGTVESRRGGDSTFSSPAPSVRSLTTTLTTIQSMAPNGTHLGTTNSHTHQHIQQHNSIHFNQPFPTTAPVSAIPPHLTPSGSTPGHPTTYSTATANNLLTDNASILTLASSSKRRRRRSLDTDASVRAMAPSSLWGGSRESLPLSVLSANIDGTGAGGGAPGLQHTNSRIGERTSIYSATGIMAGERNSLYAKQSVTGTAGAGGDGSSVRSGLLGHGRADSVTGSIGGLASPLVSPREEAVPELNGVDDTDEGEPKENEKTGAREQKKYETDKE